MPRSKDQKYLESVLAPLKRNDKIPTECPRCGFRRYVHTGRSRLCTPCKNVIADLGDEGVWDE